VKVVLVLSDALRDDIAAERMGFLEHLIETHQGTRYTVRGELPTLSRPMYETVHTGLPVTQHGIYSNQQVRRSSVPNVFEIAVRNDPSLLIQHGRFYMEDSFPDQDLFLAAASLVRKFSPDYLLIHPMGLDYRGDSVGSATAEYRNHAIVQDIILANLVPEWLQRGYTILVSGDHGMSADHSHGGTTADVRMVPLYILPPAGDGDGNTRETVSQLQVAPTILTLLGLPLPATMKHPPIG